MRAAIIQSNYIPWRGYFDFIDDVDVFIFHDDIQYTKADWRNRNRIKTSSGVRWMTVPVKHAETSQLISETRIDYTRDWITRHKRMLEASYRNSPYFEEHFQEYSMLLENNYETISDLNIAVCSWITRVLQIPTPLRRSMDLNPKGAKTERIISILKDIGADVYLSGPTAKGYLDHGLFREHDIGLEFKAYHYTAYPQLWGEFEPAVTVLDLLFNLGPAARQYLKSLSPNEVCIEPRS